jgi:hypothetical protein
MRFAAYSIRLSTYIVGVRFASPYLFSGFNGGKIPGINNKSIAAKDPSN